MKRLFVILFVASAVIIAGCSKTEDEVSPFSQKNADNLKANPVPRPFYGDLTGLSNILIPSICAGNSYSFAGEGEVTHLGNSDCYLTYCSTTQYAPVGPGGMMIPVGGNYEGEGTLIAANGDELYSVVTGSYTLVYNSSFQLVSNVLTGTGDITGGTGRFENADGIFDVAGEQDMTIFPFNTPTTFHFSGTIIY